MAGILQLQDDHAELAELLSQVRSMIMAAGCANQIDAERWLVTWLDTPNGALAVVEPRRLLEQADNESAIR